MSVTKKPNEIIIGAGELYLQTFTGDVIPEHATIETEANNVGHCNSGFSVEYKPSIYEVKNQYGNIVESYVEAEEVTCNTGIISWDLGNLAKFSTGEVTTETGEKVITIGGKKYLETLLVRFVHTKKNGKKIRFTCIGQSSDGFSLAFENKELTIDAKIKAIEKISKFVCSFAEEIETP